MIYQMIYGKNPSFGYRELKYSAGIMTDEYLDNRLFDAFKVKLGLSEYNYEGTEQLPVCVCFICSNGAGKPIYAFGSISVELRNGEYTNLSHFYIFTSFDADDALAADTQSSVFNLKPFVQNYSKIQTYDIDSGKIYNADNSFSIEAIKESLEVIGINRSLFINIIHKLFLALQTNSRLFIVAGDNIFSFTKNALNLLRGIFYILPAGFLNSIGFITYLRYVSDSDMLHESIKIAVIDNNEKNQDDYIKLTTDGHFVVDVGVKEDNSPYDAGLLLELMASIIFDNADKGILDGFYKHAEKYLKDAECKEYALYALLYRHYAAVAAKSFELDLKDIYNELLLYADKLNESIFSEASIETVSALKESIVNISFESDKPAMLESVFAKLKTISNYSVEMFTDGEFLDIIKDKLNQAFDVTDYSLLKHYYSLSTSLESDIVNEDAANNLIKIKEDFINGTFSAVKSQDISLDDKLLIEGWTDEQTALLDEGNKKKIFDVFISKALKSSLYEPAAFNKLLSDFKNEIKTGGYLQARLAEYRDTLALRYQGCVDAKEIRIYFQIFAIIFDNNIELFKIIFDKDGLYDLLFYIKILEDKANSEDLNFIGEVLENFNSSKMKKDVKAFFLDEKYKHELEKAAYIDKNVDLFAKKYKIFDNGKKGWFSKG